MPFKKHPEFLPPPKSDAKIWRYMSLTKFLSILDRSSLYFTRLDQLSKFDPFEGYYTNLNLLFEKKRFEEMSAEWKKSSGITTPEIFSKIIEGCRRTRKLVKYHQEITFVNSWYIKEYESAAMWNLYLSNYEGIAIQSTFEKLVECLSNYQEFDVFIGKIKYIDYDKEEIPMGNVLSPFVYKRKSFEHEDELRALIWTPQYGKNDLINPKKNKYKNVFGIYIPINLKVLIDKVYVAPSAPEWIAQLISSLIKKYELKKNVVRSNLASRPIY